jgi:hypothetical protein
MKNCRILIASLGFVLLASGCATYQRQGLDAQQAREVETSAFTRDLGLSRETEDKILALNPEHVTTADLRDVLVLAPAPRIINIHGGVFPVHKRMVSFSHFLIGMGYPQLSIVNPGDGTYTFSCYESSLKVAGVIAWYYEKEGMPPIIVGHSQGGFQALKVLHELAGHTADRIEVWNPLTWKPEGRFTITDPLTGTNRPVVGLKLGFATVTGAGGLTRILPNQWGTSIRSVPDSVQEFTGFYKGMDLLGGDFLGYGPMNHYHPNGTAKVRTVQLPSYYKHGSIPDTEHLLKSQKMKDWINNYVPTSDEPELTEPFDADSRHILWAADVWRSIKRHWVLELQALIRAKRAQRHAS